MLPSDRMGGNGHKFCEIQTEMQEILFNHKETFFNLIIRMYLGFASLRGIYVTNCGNMPFYQKDCVNYSFSSAVKLKNSLIKTDIEQAKCHF